MAPPHTELVSTDPAEGVDTAGVVQHHGVSSRKFPEAFSKYYPGLNGILI